jgi:putative transposase
MTIKEKKQRVQPTHPNLSIQRQCELIGLPWSSYYREGSAEQESPENIEIMKHIDKEYTDHPFYGTRQMRNVLRRKGCPFGQPA